VVVAGHGRRPHALKAKLIAKREFARVLEYVLDEALFTSPPIRTGAARRSSGRRRLLGIGSLMVQEEIGGAACRAHDVPIDLLEPILDDLLKLGPPSAPRRPWPAYATGGERARRGLRARRRRSRGTGRRAESAIS